MDFWGPFKLSNRKDIQKPRNLIFCLFFGVEAGWLSFYSDASALGRVGPRSYQTDTCAVGLFWMKTCGFPRLQFQLL